MAKQALEEGAELQLAIKFGAQLLSALADDQKRNGSRAANVRAAVHEAAAAAVTDAKAAARLAQGVLDTFMSQLQARDRQRAAEAARAAERAEAEAAQFCDQIYAREHGLLNCAYQNAHENVRQGDLSMSFITTDPPPKYGWELHRKLLWEMLKEVEPVLRQRYGSAFSEAGARRAFELVHDEHMARHHGFSVEYFRQVRDEEQRALADAPRISLFEYAARERQRAAGDLSPSSPE